MAIKRLVPMSDMSMTGAIEFADGFRTLPTWERAHANNEDARARTGKLLIELTYQEWLDKVASQFGLLDWLNNQKVQSKSQIFSHRGF